jgi:hypothetical protein
MRCRRRLIARWERCIPGNDRRERDVGLDVSGRVRLKMGAVVASRMQWTMDNVNGEWWWIRRRRKVGSGATARFYWTGSIKWTHDRDF